MQRVSSRELGHSAGTYLIEVPLVSEFVKFDLNQSRTFSVWVRHKVASVRTQRWRLTIAPCSVDVDGTEQLIGMCEVYGIWYCCWGSPVGQ